MNLSNNYKNVHQADSRIYNAAKSQLASKGFKIVASAIEYLPIKDTKQRQLTSTGAIIVKGDIGDLIRKQEFPGTVIKSNGSYIILSRNKLTKMHPAFPGRSISGEERLIIQGE